jgi:hypothetical protein
VLVVRTEDPVKLRAAGREDGLYAAFGDLTATEDAAPRARERSKP